jgi:hypothetical protein
LNVHPDYTSFDPNQVESDEFPVDHYAEFLTWLKHQHAGTYWQALPRTVARFVKRRVAAVMVLLASGHPDLALLLAWT